MSKTVARERKIGWADVKDFALAIGTKAGQDNLPRLASSFSFFSLLSIAPFLVLAVTVGALLLGRNHVAQHLLNEADRVGGHQVRDYLRVVIRSSQRKSTGTIASLLSLGVTFFSASGLFLNLDDGVSWIWGTPARGSFIKNLILTRIVAFMAVMIFGGILLGWLTLDTTLGVAAKQHSEFPGWQIVSLLVSVAFFTFGFALSFKVLPRDTVRWRDALSGGFVVAAGLSISKFLLAMYFGHLTGVYTAAGGVVVLLLWMYYMSMLYYLGVEITYLYTKRGGSIRRTGEEPVSLAANTALKVS